MKSAKIREKIDQLEARLSEVRSDLDEREEKLDSLREEHGKAIARGDGKATVEDIKARIREVTDEVDGLGRAAPLLEEAIRGTKQDLERAEREESAAEAKRLSEDGLAAVEALHEKLTEVIEGEILPLAERAEIATSTAWGAEREVARLSDQRPPSTSRVIRDGWWQHQGLQQLIEAFRFYLAGGPQAYRREKRIEKQKAEAVAE